MEQKYKVGSIVIMKKPHACKENKWCVTRVGVDIKLKCLGCGHVIMLDRLEFERKLRRIIDEES